jgi:hypothetical protein
VSVVGQATGRTVKLLLTLADGRCILQPEATHDT